ncbi:sigma-54-dependent transcriptional regulator [Amphibiibacter pelophylacis]|uniref:Sigma-54 dependent transcriptional regulator n=1 Tax=Amphibiibacter pelophylacis TaxID=1799477 RepID=A0ACC6P019_9BURK
MDSSAHTGLTVLVVDDERQSQAAMRRALEEHFDVLCASDATQAREALQAHEVAAVICDQRMPGLSGVDFLKEVRDTWPQVVRFIISGHTDSEDIIRGVNEAGICQYLLKPWRAADLLNSVMQAVQATELTHSVQRLDLELRKGTGGLRRQVQRRQQQLQTVFGMDRIVRRPDSPMDALCRSLARVAVHDVAVLLLGESGTGKELLARAMHYASPRQTGPFVAENCAALTDTLLESELFGHRKGAFTGAVSHHAGLFERANGGTLFLDEIGDTSPAFQVKLLRVLQEGEVRPVGATQPISVDVRVVAATHRPLHDDVRAGRFREDLFYRLAEVRLDVPPLRDRGAGDIAAIAQTLLPDLCAHLARPSLALAPEALALIQQQPWPGNVRELRNTLLQAVLACEGTRLTVDCFADVLGPVRSLTSPTPQPLSPRGPLEADLPGAEDSATPLTPVAPLDPADWEALAAPLQSGETLQDRVDAVEKRLIAASLEQHRWNRSRVAQELGLSRVGLRGKMQRLGLE